MQIGSLGDMAKNYSLQTRNTSLKQDIQRLTVELSSGQVADVRAAVTGRTAFVNDISRGLGKLDAFERATTQATLFVEGVQASLNRITEVGDAFAGQLISLGSTAYSAATAGISEAASQSLESVVGALNSNVAGRSLFSGTDVDTLPLIDAESLAATVAGVVAGTGSVDDMITAAETWFNDPAGFASVAYQGAAQSLRPTALSEQDTAEFDIRADDPAFRDMLRNLTMISLAEAPALALTDAQKSELFQKSTEPFLSARDRVTGIQARVGYTEGKIESVRSRNAAERSALETAHNGIFSADPYNTATELEQIQFQLQSLYAVTSRMSRLSLVNFL